MGKKGVTENLWRILMMMEAERLNINAFLFMTSDCVERWQGKQTHLSALQLTKTAILYSRGG